MEENRKKLNKKNIVMILAVIILIIVLFVIVNVIKNVSKENVVRKLI
ncbi:MAG: hypothetical protein HFJ46_00935 [Clostridia bacterium]|nr:hypothetical protein [Clostridia bacterium]